MIMIGEYCKKHLVGIKVFNNLFIILIKKQLMVNILSKSTFVFKKFKVIFIQLHIKYLKRHKWFTGFYFLLRHKRFDFIGLGVHLIY